jgi:low affinity Fe/Cu permease
LRSPVGALSSDRYDTATGTPKGFRKCPLRRTATPIEFSSRPDCLKFKRSQMRNTAMKFAKIAQKLALLAGSPRTFLGAIILIFLWGLSGPIFHFNDTWQLIINTSTTIITFLMVFLIQNTQNRDTDILHLKVDELLRVTKEAQNAMLGLEALDLKELEALRKQYRQLGEGETISLDGTVVEENNKQDLNKC